MVEVSCRRANDFAFGLLLFGFDSEFPRKLV